MANPNISVDVSGNTAKLRQQINQVAKQPLVIDVQAGGRGAAQPLGKLSGQITEIDKSLAAANARVIAFGAAAGSIFALQNAVVSLFQSFVNTEKKLQDINVILNLSEKNLAAFGSSLFDIAGNTAQAFDVVAEAATELSRQGLGVEETLKRTEAALILTRLSGLDAAASVAALTATMNSFQSATLEATEIVNKLANVDAAFAVSSADLANALSRVGSSADDAGISFDELIALVTTAQQITARGGAVIGNSLKTIFTRLGREKVQEVLGGLGISATDESGQVKTQIQLLKELALVYDTLGATQKNYVAEQVGGVFQINILKAALGDLGKEYSIYDRALKTSLSSTDQAIQRNEQLNQTLSALGTKTLANVQKVAGTLGEGLFGDAARNVLNLTNLLTESVGNADSQSVGGQIGRGVIDGLGKFIAGPGLALATAIIVKLLAEFTKYGAEAFKSILGTNQAGKEQVVVQQNIAKFLQNNSGLYNSILKGQVSVSTAAKEYLAVIQQQTAALQRQNSVAASISKSLAGSVGVQTIGGRQFVATKTKTAAAGYLPESIEQANINARVGGANPATDRPVTIPNFAFGGGKKGKITAHTGEWVVPNFAGGDGTAIFNKDMKAKYGLPSGARKISSSGFIPNFAKTKLPPNISLEEAIQSNQYSRSQLSQRFTAEAVNSRLGTAKKPSLGKSSSSTIDLGKTSTLSLIYGEKAGIKDETGFFNTDQKGLITDKKTPNGKTYKVGFKSSGYNAKVKPEDAQLEKLLGDQVIDFTNRFISIFGNYSPNARIKSVQQLANYGSFRSIAGNIFESAVTQATDSAVTQAGRSGGSSAIIDFVNPNDKLRKLFNNIPGDYEAKIGNQQNLINDVARKAFISNKLKIKPGQLSRSKASGFIPNFSSTNRGVPVSQIRAHFDKSGNPVAVTNTRDEPNGLKDAIGRERKGMGMYATGFTPNFAVGSEGEAQGGISDFAKSIGAVAAQIALFASISQLGKKDVNELKETYKQRAELERKSISQQKANLQKMSTMGPGPLQRGSSGYNAAMLDIEQRAQAQRAARRSGAGILQRGISSAKGFRPGIGTAFAAPIIAETIANAIPQNTQGGRVGASAVSGAGQIASFAGTGGMVGMAFGPKGAAVGAALGAVTGGLIGLTDILKQLNTNLPELQAKAEKSTEELAKVNEKTQGLATSYETYTRLLEENAPQSELRKAEQNYINYLNSFDPETAKKFTNAIKERGMQGLTEVSGQITQKQAEQTARNQADVSVEQLLNTQRRSIIARAFEFVGRSGSGPNAPGMLVGKQPPIETYSGEMTKDIRDAFKKQINAGITQGLTDSDLETRLKELGGKEQIQKDFGKLISDTLNIDPRAIEESSGFKKVLSELYGEVFDEVGINIKGQAEKTRSLAAGAIKDASKKIAQQLSQDIDSLLSYNKNKSAISQLESDFFGGEIGQNEFVARRSQERIKEALSLGATPEEIFTRFGSDVMNVRRQAGNNAAQRAFDLGLPVDYQNRARMLNQQAVGEATGTSKLGIDYLKNRFLPEGGKFEGSSKEVEAAIKALQQLGGFADRSEAFKAYETIVNAMAFDLTTSAEQAAANFKLIESSVQAMLEYFTTTAEKSGKDKPQPSNFEKPISLTDSPSVVPSININPGPVSFTLGGLTREDLDLKLTAEKQRILDEFSAKMQQLKAQNNLK
jgi:TP901 family phage tail tape measure protein